jgi:hypothetical protein
MNILQHIPKHIYGDVLVTLNPPRLPNPRLTQSIIPYRHPLFNPPAIGAQKNIHKINGKRGLHFTGAWTGYGFHEDGFASGIQAGIACGGSVPWNVVETKEIRGKSAEKAWDAYLVRFFISAILIWLNGLEMLLVLWQVYAPQIFQQPRASVRGKGKQAAVGTLPSESRSRFFSYRKAGTKRSLI